MIFFLTGYENFTCFLDKSRRNFYGKIHRKPKLLATVLESAGKLPDEMVKLLLKAGSDFLDQRCDAKEALELLQAMYANEVPLFLHLTDSFEIPTVEDFEHKASTVGLPTFDYSTSMKSVCDHFYCL